MTLPTPPKYVVLPAEAIDQAYAPDKPRRALLASFIRILSLAWETKYERTPDLNEDELMEFLKLSRRQYFEQKADMELLGWLRSSHPRPGFVRFSFARIVAQRAEQATEQASAENRTPDAENRTEIVVVDSLNLNSLKTPPTILNGEASAKNRTDETAGEYRTDQPVLPSVTQILAQTPLLFDGAEVISKGLEGRSALVVLQWCAYVYAQKRTMSAPGGVLRNKLKENALPPAWTADRWHETLPESFLRALGLWTEEPEQDSETTEAEIIYVVVAPDESVNERLDDGKTMSPAQAWQSVLGQLQIEMPRASFETWVRGTQAIRYDSNTLTVGVANAYAREWLENRLTSTVQRLLVGILNRAVQVIFVVMETEVPA